MSKSRITLLNILSIIFAVPLSFFTYIVGGYEGEFKSLLDISLAVSAFLIIPAVILCIFYSQKHRSRDWALVGICVPFFPFFLGVGITLFADVVSGLSK